jgi:hypothetical protein
VVAAFLLHAGVQRSGRSMNGLLPAACVPKGRRGLPYPGVKSIGDKIGTVGPHPALSFFAEFVYADRAQDV